MVVLQGNPANPDENRVVRVLNCFKRPDYASIGDMYGFYSDWEKGFGGLSSGFHGLPQHPLSEPQKVKVLI